MEWSIQDLGAAGEFVGAIAVVVTLIYLGVQIRQHTNSLKSSTIEAVTERQQAEARWSSDISAAWVKLVNDPDLLTPEESWQLSEWHTSAFMARHNEFLQYRQGLIDKALWQQSERIIVLILSTDWAMDWWNNLGRAVYPDEFVQEIDRIADNKAKHDLAELYGAESQTDTT